MTIPQGVILISGGSRGLGLAMTQRLLSHGAKIASFARTETAAVAALRKQYPENYWFEPLDMLDTEKLEAFVNDAAQRFGEIFALVNNAAIGQDHFLVHMSSDMIRDILAINLQQPILLTKAVLKKMLLNENGGRIVNVSSICGSRGYTGLSVYSTTKAGLDALTRSLAREVGARNILINSIAPGFFLSEMSSVLASNQIDAIRRRTPTEQLSDVGDVLPVLEMLLFENTNITGQTLFVDGGASN
ncbi:MAG: SDR family oxidoreductase [bacterium]|nr:SDR family oxidoreductase [bacterium]